MFFLVFEEPAYIGNPDRKFIFTVVFTSFEGMCRSYLAGSVISLYDEVGQRQPVDASRSTANLAAFFHDGTFFAFFLGIAVFVVEKWRDVGKMLDGCQ